jgi:hypothetical protein
MFRWSMAKQVQYWNGRGHFLGATAEAMWRILVHSARRKAGLQHGGKRQREDAVLEFLNINAPASLQRHGNSSSYCRAGRSNLGMLPFPAAYKAVAEQVDFVSPHLYPKAKKVDEEIELLKKFDFGKLIVIGETFPLSCSADEEREFLLKSASSC